DRMLAVGFEQAPSFNPYWVVHGRTFRDPDGYRIVLQQDKWREGEKACGHGRMPGRDQLATP
ncbi:MAG TPA: hypothetical protein VD839_00910, partial [Burkholderiales bacterium]|nr:hypothetical protein [Burkholderiales bacterium]